MVYYISVFILFFVKDNTQYAGFLRICNTTFFDKDNTSVEVDHAHNNSIRIKKCFFGFIFTEGKEGGWLVFIDYKFFI